MPVPVETRFIRSKGKHVFIVMCFSNVAVVGLVDRRRGGRIAGWSPRSHSASPGKLQSYGQRAKNQGVDGKKLPEEIKR